MPGTRRSGVKKMPPNLASGLKRTKEQKASEELERVREWVTRRGKKARTDLARIEAKQPD